MNTLTCIQAISWEREKPIHRGKTNDGTIQRRKKHTKHDLSVNVTYNVRTFAEAQTVEDHWVANAAASFTYYKLWESPGDYTAPNQITMYYKSKPKIVKKTHNSFNIDIQLESSEND